MKTLPTSAPPVRIDTAPIDLSDQPRVLTDAEVDKVAGGVGAEFAWHVGASFNSNSGSSLSPYTLSKTAGGYKD
jgi:hypothetical protein